MFVIKELHLTVKNNITSIWNVMRKHNMLMCESTNNQFLMLVFIKMRTKMKLFFFCIILDMKTCRKILRLNLYL